MAVTLSARLKEELLALEEVQEDQTPVFQLLVEMG